MRFDVILLIFALLLPANPAWSTDASVPEGQLIAAYLYNFLHFVEWPADQAESAEAASEHVLRLGVIDAPDVLQALRAVEGQRIPGRKMRLSVLDLRVAAGKERLQMCHVLFLSRDAKAWQREILQAVYGLPVLTIGYHEEFLEAGGMIELIRKGQGLRWRVNRGALQPAGLQVSSQLLRNAVEVLRNSRGQE